MGTGKCGLYKGTYGSKKSHNQEGAISKFNSAGSKLVNKVNTINSSENRKVPLPASALPWFLSALPQSLPLWSHCLFSSVVKSPSSSVL